MADVSRRDYFAAAALQGMLAGRSPEVPATEFQKDVDARFCWQVADALLAHPLAVAAAAEPNESRHGVFATTTNAPPAPAADAWAVVQIVMGRVEMRSARMTDTSAANECRVGQTIAPLYLHPPAPAGEAERLRKVIIHAANYLEGLVNSGVVLDKKGILLQGELNAALGAERGTP